MFGCKSEEKNKHVGVGRPPLAKQKHFCNEVEDLSAENVSDKGIVGSEIKNKE